jgi:two-component system NarL family sensor kinase
MNTYHIMLAFVAGTFMLMLFVCFIIIFLIVHKKKRYGHLLEKQTMESNYQNQLLLSKLEVQEQSFRYFSEEMHDNIGQLMSIVKMQLYNIRNNSKEPEIVAKATDSGELLGKAIHDLRNISHTLNSSYVANAGLAQAIEKDLEYIRSAKDINCNLHITGDDYSLGPERELLIFRIIQEAVGNAVKHAKATAINVYLGYKPESLCLSIEDNGTGFDPSENTKGGIGLTNMQVRAGLLKGGFQVFSAKDCGTTVRLEVMNEE